MLAGLFPVNQQAKLLPIEPPPELVAASGEALDMYLQGQLKMDDD